MQFPHGCTTGFRISKEIPKSKGARFLNLNRTVIHYVDMCVLSDLHILRLHRIGKFQAYRDRWREREFGSSALWPLIL